MDRRLLFPVIAVTAWAQQPSPAEQALRTRAGQFYQLEVDGKFRAAEALVAEDTKDYYFDNGKPNLVSYKLGDVEFKDPTHAIVTLIATVHVVAPGLGSQNLPVTAKHTWKLENGEWCWYIDQTATAADTPFGKMHPGTTGSTNSVLPMQSSDLSDVNKLISIDRTTVDLSPEGTGSVTISNQLPGGVSLEIDPNHPKDLIVETDKDKLGHGEKAIVSFRAADGTKPTGSVRITVQPLGKQFTVQVQSSSGAK